MSKQNRKQKYLTFKEEKSKNNLSEDYLYIYVFSPN